MIVEAVHLVVVNNAHGLKEGSSGQLGLCRQPSNRLPFVQLGHPINEAPCLGVKTDELIQHL